MKSPRALPLILLVLAACGSAPLCAEPDAAFEKSSMAWRTALHFDPGAEAPLMSLLGLYQQSGRIGELTALYQNHVAQYPTDEGAKVVLARLWVELQDTRADDFLRQASSAHPQNALLAHARAQWLESRFDPKALEELDRAVALELMPVRRAAWLAELLKKAANAGREDLIQARFNVLVKENAFTPVQRVQWARRSLEAAMHRAAADLLAGFDPTSLQGDDGVEAQIVAARVALAGNQRTAASQHLARLLDRLAPDHWRRREVMTLHWQAADEAGRAQLLEQSAQRWHQSRTEANALSHGDLLISAGRQMEALKLWREAANALPSARSLEERTLELMEQMRRDDDALGFLQELVSRHPEREDLALKHARWLLMLGRVEEGMVALDSLLAGKGPAQRAETQLLTARWLRTRNLFGEAATLLERLIAAQPARWDVRKELAELLALLKRREDMERLFDGVMPDDTAPEVRLEVAQFLISQQLWPAARRLLEAWVDARPAEFDGRLLLAKICSLQDDEAAAEVRLKQCRDLCDTETRHAAWLAAAWARAVEMETTDSLIAEERQHLWPKEGEVWDAARLARLSALAAQSTQDKERDDAEKLVREALQADTLPEEQKQDLRAQLIMLLEGVNGREKELESEIQLALQTAPADAADLRLRLALLYHHAQRLDLAWDSFLQADAAACKNTDILRRAANACLDMRLSEQAAAFLARVTRLEPDERTHWIAWTSVLAEMGEEEPLRGALREMRARAANWNLTDMAREHLRRHLAASYWRTTGLLLSQEPLDADAATRCLAVLDELEGTEVVQQRRLWATWARGLIARKRDDPAALSSSLAILNAATEEWVDFPDGLSLSMAQARRNLGQKPPRSSAPLPGPQSITTPLGMAWGFESGADLQRWQLTPDGTRLLVLDAHRRLHLLDRRSGKLVWSRILRGGGAVAFFMNSRYRGGEVLSIPCEWSLDDHHLVTLDEGGLGCLSLQDGREVWHKETPTGSLGALTMEHEIVAAWWPEAGRLDGMEVRTGKLLWSQTIPPLAAAPVRNQHQPVWFAAGVDADADRVLAWGNGMAICDLNDGAILWKASATDLPAFPMDLTAGDEHAAPASNPAAVPWTSTSIMFSRQRSSGTRHRVLSNPLAVPGYGFPGMYGNPTSSPWVVWGAEDSRLLRGDQVWMLNQQYGITRISSHGLPSASNTAANNTPGAAVGFAGRGLVVATQNQISRLLPTGEATLLWSLPHSNSRPAENPMPSTVLLGRTLLIALRDELIHKDAITGASIWQGEWPREAREWTKDAWESLDKFQSMRWSARGLWLYDNQGRTMTIDWKACAAHGDWIIPAGMQKLVCLRGSGGGSAAE